MKLAGLVLAGGRGSRMGGAVPKPLLDLGGRPLLAHVLDRMPEDANPVLLGAGDAHAFGIFGLPVVADRIEGFAGPLAGLDAAAAYLAARHPDVTHLLCLPADTPFLPRDLAGRLTDGCGGTTRVASRGGILQPAAALFATEGLAALPDFLGSGEKASIRRFLEIAGFEAVEIDGTEDEAPGGDPFFNVNTPADLDAARAFLVRHR